jgi:hypothetical protein
MIATEMPLYTAYSISLRRDGRDIVDANLSGYRGWQLNSHLEVTKWRRAAYVAKWDSV